MKFSFLKLMIGILCLTIVGCTGMQADIKLAQEDYEGAIGLYNEALNNSPDSVHALSRLGFCYFKTNRIEEAIAKFEKALEIQPGEPFSVLYLGLAYINKEQFSKTLDVWQGFKDETKPIVEEEIKRMMPIVTMALGQKSAKEALANEEKIAGIKLDSNTIAVAYLADESPDKSMKAFQKGLTAMIITDLAKVKSLKVVERERLQALFQEMKLGQTGIIDAKTAPRVGKLLKAENVVAGSVTTGSIKASVSVASASTAKVKGTANATVDIDKFYQLPSLLIESIANVLDVDLSPVEKAAIGVPHTKNLKAFTFFGSALDALDDGNWQKAKDFFAMALKEDPSFSMARSGNDSSPGADSPSMQSIQAVDVTAISAAMSQAVENASAAQDQSDADSASAGTSDSGSDGGSSGGGGGQGGY